MPIRGLPAARVAILALAGCAAPAPARIVVGDADTAVVNDRAPVPLPVRVLDAEGRPLRADGVRFQWVGGDRIALTEDGRVTCDRAGDAEIRVALGTFTARGVVRCRPVRGFRSLEPVHLLLGAPPVELPLFPVGVDGRPVTLLAASAGVRDTAIATLHDGRLSARAPGQTFVDVRVGECETAIGVDVVERVTATDSMRPDQELVVAPLRLVPGEVRSWRIPPGRYDVRLLPDDDVTSATLPLGVVGANCAPFPGTTQRYSCVASERATVVVRHARATARERDAQLVVRRRRDATSSEAPRHSRRPVDRCVDELS